MIALNFAVSTGWFTVAFVVVFPFVLSYKVCLPEEGGGVCPNYDTCCPTSTPGISSCISAKRGDRGACCTDDGLGLTGCADGYKCSSISTPTKTAGSSHLRLGPSERDEYYFCERIDPYYNGTKPKPPILDRYKLSSLSRDVLENAYGLPMIDEGENLDRVNAAYFSTMGSMDTQDPVQMSRHQQVTTVLIVVHGSGRTADDYLYGAYTSLPRDQQDPRNSTIMVLAPWFLDRDDDKAEVYNDTDANNNTVIQHDYPVKIPNNTLRWIEESEIVPHTWRYGADAINSTISAFAVVDRMVERLVEDPVRFPSLVRILVAGHSAGGQFVQRWALLSNSPVWGTNPEDSRHQISSNPRSVSIRAIPANPRCFAFLDDRRYIQDELNQTVFQRPSASSIIQCPEYNEWIWGLEPGGDVIAPYKDDAIRMAGGAEAVARRYVARRRLIYLAGEKDEEVFEDDCGSVMQGTTRRERSRGFMASLHELFPEEMKANLHERLVVKGSPHDHTLMFQSPEGQRALFGEDDWSESFHGTAKTVE